MEAKVLVVGRRSFLARHAVAALGADRCRVVGHEAVAEGAVDAALFDGVGAVVNFAFHPALRAEGYRPELDVDRRIAAARPPGVHVVVLSSRAVYAPGAAFGADEDSPLDPATPYGRAKLAVENAVRARVPPEDLTVLRVANAVGFERDPGRRSFMAAVLRGLAEEARVTFDMSPAVRRDFLPAGLAADAIARVVRRRLAGTYNLGSGTALACGDVARWTIEGYGRGELRVLDDRVHDEFRLDVRRIEAAVGPVWPDPDPAAFFRELGRRLREETAASGR